MYARGARGWSISRVLLVDMTGYDMTGGKIVLESRCWLSTHRVWV